MQRCTNHKPQAANLQCSILEEGLLLRPRALFPVELIVAGQEFILEQLSPTVLLFNCFFTQRLVFSLYRQINTGPYGICAHAGRCQHKSTWDSCSCAETLVRKGWKPSTSCMPNEGNCNQDMLRTGNSQPRILPSGRKGLFPDTKYSEIWLLYSTYEVSDRTLLLRGRVATNTQYRYVAARSYH